MKKLMTLLVMLACVFILSACHKEKNTDISHFGINAEIVEIDTVNQIVYVADDGEDGFFGVKSPIDCKKLIADENIIYVDYETEALSIIQFSDLAVGDKVIIEASESQLSGISDGIIEVEQIQLATQRLHIDGRTR